jgi:zinc transport system substrate-binding protein
MSVSRRSILAATTLGVMGAGASLTACSSTSASSGPAGSTAATASAAASNASPSAAGPKVVAATSWEGGLAKAAGATDISVIAPANLTHAPDYDPKPSDLAAVADADIVLYADFEGFAGKIKEATGSKAELLPLQLENSPKAIRAEVTRLGEKFGTSAAATKWLATFDTEYARLSEQVKQARPASPPVTVSQAFMAYWVVDFAGLAVSGTYGPKPLTASELQTLAAKKPRLVVANAHMPGDPDISGATKVTLINYPGEDLDLMTVFATNADLLAKALRGL